MYLENAKDEIRIESLEVYAYHGVFPKEKKRGQPFVINAVLYTDTRKAGKSDRLEQSTDYGDVCHFIEEWMVNNNCDLIETVAEKLAQAVLLKYDLICAIDLEIRKPEAPIEQPFGCVSVRIYRKWHLVFLSVGSNMGDKRQYILDGVQALREHPLIVVRKVSDLIETRPYGGVEQDDFLNGVLEIETLLTPHELLDALHEIEAAAERVREVHWGPRTLDIDIIFYDKLVYEDDDLIIPHQDMENRSFVLEPLSTLAPNYRHPVLGKTVARLLREQTERK
ncbi:MAG: 2-amino-4-hydroxy-6-hydroxymethyldihydropteridine diphosphokinase [Lachnospiraceae bacterium]|nr:2-amino-4-hydroxy-6-hydroxymethyldihydropteridine diphosphokinase [Lachnospiraceae bacterium]MCM1239492.1 2-amino-4-hydroxy-6-hydroxymethyldihydropteridine diphosphokinase [Lachnospiraceae bacterium]MCM1304974.1 2-amino-4-hydroxy-6-hydroxymethyldihydropteridine diphosphokinase [Butyrivibrio sp.]MCM1344507.1 2-amino-4-hydroxy-6-hydroxymethyldihydropteridine diphosphokinase [Muribaculaceae bacterium]MCM1411800.1 2-amino-4-hydroxy-6-hydroxymethyldihydropteridine diphosphokinase [Lachnospiraceae